MRRAQRGIAMVEFAVGGAVALAILFGCIEISRALYAWNTVAEATRAAAHIAAICPVGDPAIAQAAMISERDGRSRVLHGLTPAMVDVAYLDAAGAPTATPSAIEYVSVTISGYEHTLAIPFAAQTLTVPAFTTTVPAESLGYIPDLDASVCLEA